MVAQVDVAADGGIRASVMLRWPEPSARRLSRVYDASTTSRCRPIASMARLGSDVHPKGYQQLEAIGFQRGTMASFTRLTMWSWVRSK